MEPGVTVVHLIYVHIHIRFYPNKNSHKMNELLIKQRLPPASSQSHPVHTHKSELPCHHKPPNHHHHYHLPVPESRIHD